MELMFELIAPKGGSVGLPGHPTKQLRTQRHGPRTRPSQPRPRSLTTPQSRRRAASASRAGPSVAGLGLQPGERALRAEAALPAAPSPAGPTRTFAERTKRGRPSARRGPDHFRAAASVPPTPPTPGHTLSSWTPSCAARPLSPPRDRGARRIHDAPHRARQAPPRNSDGVGFPHLHLPAAQTSSRSSWPLKPAPLCRQEEGAGRGRRSARSDDVMRLSQWARARGVKGRGRLWRGV